MAVFLIERGQIAAKIETTKGTVPAPAPAAIDAGIEIYDLSFNPTVEVHERETIHATFGKPAAVIGARFAEITFRSPVQGHTGPGLVPAVGPLLRACGFSETVAPATSVAYALITQESAQETITIDMYRDGKRYRITGAMGNVTMEARLGDVPFFEFTFVGIYTAPEDQAMLTNPPYIAVAPPQPVNATLTFFSETMCATGWTLDVGNDVQLREAVTEATGRKHAVIVNREPTISIDPEDELVATIEFLNKLTQGAVGELVATIGSVAGNTLTMSVPHAQITEAPFGDRNGLVTRDLTIMPRENVFDSDDAFTLTWT